MSRGPVAGLTEHMTRNTAQDTAQSTARTTATAQDTTEDLAGTTLVVAGHGKTGRRVAEQLTARGHAVRVGSRSARPPFDWEDPETWAPALRGVRAAYLACQPDVGAPGVAETVRDFSRLAADSGVRRLVLLSARGEDPALPTEQAVRESGTDWTILRASWFCQNFSEGFWLDNVRGGEVDFPAGETPEPFIDLDDLAEVAVTALTETGDRHSGQTYELTGPGLLTMREAVAEIAEATGREVRYRPLNAEQSRVMLADFGIAPEEAAWLTDLFIEFFDGRNAHLTDDVQRVLGRPPRDFASYAKSAAASGVWNG